MILKDETRVPIKKRDVERTRVKARIMKLKERGRLDKSPQNPLEEG